MRGPRYGSWGGSNANTGSLISQPFRTSFALTITIAGHPSHRQETIELVRLDDPRRRIRLDLGDDPGERWEKRIVRLPLEWRNVPVRLIATDSGKGWGDWLGIADVHSTDFGEIVSDDVRIRTLIFGALALTTVVPFIFLGSALCRRLDLPELFLFSAVLLILGVTAEAVFFLTMVSTKLAASLLWIVVAGGGWATLRGLRDRCFRAQLTRADAWAPFAVTALCAAACLALFCLADSGKGSVVSFAQSWLSLPIDNDLPHFLATQIGAHAAPRPFVGDWLSSDRPPLQAGFDLSFAALVPLWHDGDSRYQALSTLLQATAFGVLFTLCRATGASSMRAAGIILLAWLSSFFFRNTVFVWPKLLAAAFMGTAICIFLAPGRLSLPRAASIGAGSALGLLSHGGVVFTLPALLVAWLVLQRSAAIRPMAVAGAVLVLFTAPWTWYQKVYDPPGDRLLKWHLAGQIPVSSEPFASALFRAYSTVEPAILAANKIANVKTLAGIDTPKIVLTGLPLSARQFFSVRYALSALLLPYLVALFWMNSRRSVIRAASAFAWIALGANLFWCLAMYLPSSTVVHQGSYLTVMLMFFAGGCIATEWLPVFLLVLGVQSYNFVITWPRSIDPALMTTPGGLGALLVLITVFGSAVALVRKPILSRIMSGARSALDRKSNADAARHRAEER